MHLIGDFSMHRIQSRGLTGAGPRSAEVREFKEGARASSDTIALCVVCIVGSVRSGYVVCA